MEEGLKKCNNCGLPETHETIDYNEQNTCNLCQSFDYKKKISIGKREKNY